MSTTVGSKCPCTIFLHGDDERTEVNFSTRPGMSTWPGVLRSPSPPRPPLPPSVGFVCQENTLPFVVLAAANSLANTTSAQSGMLTCGVGGWVFFFRPMLSADLGCGRGCSWIQVKARALRNEFKGIM